MRIASTATTNHSALLAADRAAWNAAKSAGPKSYAATNNPETVVTFSAEAVELLRRREASDTAIQEFTDIIAQARSANAYEHPKDFLYTLSAKQMDVLQQVHCLADPINIKTLSEEGASNLLRQPGSAMDLNNDGLNTIGAGHTFAFPPQNAPESFKAAWAAASEGLSPMEIPTQMIFAVGLQNIGREPGDPNWRNPYADPNYDYAGEVNRVMASLDYSLKMGGISNEKYQHDMAFYRLLSDTMQT